MEVARIYLLLVPAVLLAPCLVLLFVSLAVKIMATVHKDWQAGHRDVVQVFCAFVVVWCLIAAASILIAAAMWMMVG